VRKKILVSGGTGFIGYHVAKKCIALKWSVTILSSRKPSNLRHIKNAEYIKCDVTKKKDIQKKLSKNFDYVVNLAGYVNHVEKKKTFLSHYNGSKNLADHFTKTQLKSFVQISSGAEYGNLKSPHNESSKCLPESNYGRAKHFASKYLLRLFKKNNFPCTILRLYQVFGPKQDQNRFIPVVIQNSLNNKNFNVSSGRQQRDFLYVDDIVAAVIKCLISKKSKGEIFNVGYGKAIKIKKVLLLIIKICNGGFPTYGKINLRKEENLITYPSINKIKKFLKWKPKYSFDDGLKKTIKLYVK
jgi:nucleoside-diphosphate-sugar epimerase